MYKYIIKRVLSSIPALLLVSLITFIMIHSTPGGPFDSEKAISAEVLKNLNERYNLDAPIYVQYIDYLKSALKGDFGPSFRYPNRSVAEMIFTGLPITFELGIYALLFSLLTGICAGSLAALKPNTLQDYLPMSLAMTGISVPSFLLGPLLVLIFGIGLNWLPVSGWGMAPGDKILPSITLGSAYAAYIARLTRGGMLEVLSQDYIRTAKAKGASLGRIILIHASKGGLLPVISFLGPAIAGLLAGSFVIETIFQIPGLGRFYIQAAFNRDYTMIMGSTIFFSFLIILFNTLSDILIFSFNPKAEPEV